MRGANMKLLKKVAVKINCRLETSTDGSMKKLDILANTTDGEGLKIYSITGHEEHSFEQLAEEAASMLIAFGVKWRLSEMVEKYGAK
jgi:hypothetical protein